MNDAEKLLQTIREREIRPIPKTWFTGKKALLWSAFILALLIGVVAFSVVLFSIQQVDFSVWRHFGHTMIETLLALLPVLWLVILSFAIVIGMLSYRNSSKGYKIPVEKLIVYHIGLSVSLGTLLFYGGGAQQLDRIFESRISIYESMQEKKIKLWSMPDQGYLSGKITAIDDASFELEDFHQIRWTIDYQNATIRHPNLLNMGESVKIIGKMTDSTHFSAQEVRPWGGQR